VTKIPPDTPVLAPSPDGPKSGLTRSQRKPRQGGAESYKGVGIVKHNTNPTCPNLQIRVS
jgi:hypothetical protein